MNAAEFSRRTLEQVIVALDVTERSEALKLLKILHPEACYYKIGLQAFFALGEKLLLDIKKTGAKIFLDLKFHDIPDQVGGAGRIAAAFGVDMITVHISGGSSMLRSVIKEVRLTSRSLGQRSPKVLGVSILTSLSTEDCVSIYGSSPQKKVEEFYEMAKDCGLDGMVLSPRELGVIKKVREKERGRFVLVTPGIRPGADLLPAEDQQRIASPEDAILGGADHLVVGRPITTSNDPKKTFLEIISAVHEAKKKNKKMDEK